MSSVYSCRHTTGPRGRTTTYEAQDGWDLILINKKWVRVPRIVTVRTEWLAMACGRKDQVGLPPDVNCRGCQNDKS